MHMRKGTRLELLFRNLRRVATTSSLASVKVEVDGTSWHAGLRQLPLRLPLQPSMLQSSHLRLNSRSSSWNSHRFNSRKPQIPPILKMTMVVRMNEVLHQMWPQSNQSKHPTVKLKPSSKVLQHSNKAPKHPRTPAPLLSPQNSQRKLKSKARLPISSSK